MIHYLVQGGQLILSLSILVVLHELGHFTAAKLFGTRVEKFYLFFNPWFSIVKKKIGDTEYGIGWLPLGGYVKISGMVDESMDTKQLEQAPKSYEFRSKPAWQRIIIMVAGVVVNFLLAIFIYSVLFLGYGDKKLLLKDVKDGFWFVNKTMIENGFEDGDKIVRINDKEIASFSEAQEQMLYAQNVMVNRSGSFVNLEIKEDFVKRLIKTSNGFLFYPRIAPVVSSVATDSIGNPVSSLKSNDTILAINGVYIQFFDELKQILQDYKGDSVTLTLSKSGIQKEVRLRVSNGGKIGIINYIPSLVELEKFNKIKLSTYDYGFFEALSSGFKKSIDKIQGYYNQFKIVLNPKTEAYKSVGGFATFSKLYGPIWNWKNFWEQTAFVSLILAFMNLLPIPALDGGHIMFLLVEMITRRKPNQKILEYAQLLGLILLFLLFVYANTDFLRYD